MQLKGKRVVVTGASSGIGRAVALEVARRGAHLVLAARRQERLDEVARLCSAENVECLAIVTDVSRRDDCINLIERAGAVDVLINNAGFANFDPMATASPDDLRAMMDTNYFGAIHCTQAVLPQMLARRSGTIVNISSIAGIMGYARMGGYCATKFAMIGFSEALRAEVASQGVRIALVCPGTTETEFFVKAERGKMPAPSRLILSVSAERVARVICKSAEDGKYRRIVPFTAYAYMRFKELFPASALAMFRRVTGMME